MDNHIRFGFLYSFPKSGFRMYNSILLEGESPSSSADRGAKKYMPSLLVPRALVRTTQRTL